MVVTIITITVVVGIFVIIIRTIAGAIFEQPKRTRLIGFLSAIILVILVDPTDSHVWSPIVSVLSLFHPVSLASVADFGSSATRRVSYRAPCHYVLATK